MTGVESEQIETRCQPTALWALIDPVLDDVLIVSPIEGGERQFCVVSPAADPTAVPIPDTGKETQAEPGLLAESDSEGIAALQYRIEGIRSGVLETAAATDTPSNEFDHVFVQAVSDWALRTISVDAFNDETF